MYQTYNARPLPQRPQKRRRMTPIVVLFAVVVLAAAYVAYALLRPLPAPRTVITPPVTPALVKVNIPWPKSGPRQQAAYGADGYGVLASNGAETPTPTASVTKVITALSVLQQKPLKPGEQGPTITFTEADVALYSKYIAMDGSVVPVAAGSTMTQYQALQALLLPSANNIADTLVIWAFGDMAAYTTFANSYVKKLGMTQTTVTDASGFAPTTVSTASDLVRLGDAALDNPVITEIVQQPSAVFPGYGTMRSTNRLLGQNGIIGLKTGNTDEAGGCYLAAADVLVNGQNVRVISAIMAAPDLSTAMRDTLPIIQSTPSQFQTTRVVREGQEVGRVETAWGRTSPIVAGKAITVTAWSGTTIPALQSEAGVKLPASAGDDVGDLSLSFRGKTEKTDLKLAQPISGPDMLWRLSHPF